MKLKEILTESWNESDARQLNQILQSEYKTDLRMLLARGTDDKIEGSDPWGVRSIRKDRLPRDTSLFAHFTVTFLEKYKYPDVPKRSASKFASTDKNWAGKFGKYLYYVFPEKNANIAVVGGDSTIQYFNHILGAKKSIVQQIENLMEGVREKFRKNYISLYKYIVEFDEDVKSPEKFMSFLEKKWEDIEREGNTFYEKYNDSDNFSLKRLAYSIRKMFKNYEEYFEDLKKFNRRESREVMFDGDKYLVVDNIFFGSYFAWDGSKWTVNEKA